MDLNFIISPKIETWWQFSLFAAALTLLLYTIVRKMMSMGLSQSLHPKTARQLGSMTTWVVMGFAISIVLFIDFINHLGMPAKWLYNYLTPFVIILVFFILFLVTRARLGHK